MQELRSQETSDASFRVLSDVARLLVSESDLTALLDSIADSVGTLIPYESLIIYEANTALRQLHPVLVRDEHAEEIMRNGSCSFGEGSITGLAADRREAIVVNDVDLDPRANQIEGTPVEEESLMTVPLVARGDLKGVLNLYRLGRGNGFGEAELALAERFAGMAALALDNAHIRERLEAEIVTDHLTGLYNHRYFQERLAEEMRRSSRGGLSMSLVLIDIDDFKRINEHDGHVVGDQMLAALGSLLRTESRSSDMVCRVGGEEFAVLMPGTPASEAVAVAQRLRDRISSIDFRGEGGPFTVSMGVAEGPTHATTPKELMACANYALLQAKTQGRGQVAAYLEGEWSGVRGVPQHEVRMVGHLKLLQTLASKLNRLLDVQAIGETIIRELKSLIDYHNCRIYLLDADGETLRPIAWHGTFQYGTETADALLSKIGEGITGRVAEVGEPIYAPDAEQCEFAVHIEGTPTIEESILAVPMKFDDRIIGVVVLSKLGLNQFDVDDLRLLESLSFHAAVAFENARLFQDERQSAETANALLRVSQALTQTRDPQRVMSEVVASLAGLLGGVTVSAWIREDGGSFRCQAETGHEEDQARRLMAITFPADVAARYLQSMDGPFEISAEDIATVPSDFRVWPQARPVLVAPVRWDPDGVAVLVSTADRPFTDRDVRLARGVADMASLAMGNAARFADLEKAFLQTIEVLANALEAKDEYTSGHAREVAEFSIEVGRELGLSDEDLRTLELAGIFHDIGKIGVASNIINKPGPLDPDEMTEMQKHPALGAQILEPVEFLQPVRPIVRAGHERWDGKGYPDGLKEQEIPLGARIIFVCDAYHAMTSDRAYRKALPDEEALRRLREAVGTQFDPTVVDAFERAHARGAIRHGHRHGK